MVQQQPQAVHQVHHARNSDYGTPALVFAIGVTFFIVFFGCWWSLICSIAAIAFAANVSLFNFVIIQCIPDHSQLYLTLLTNFSSEQHCGWELPGICGNRLPCGQLCMYVKSVYY